MCGFSVVVVLVGLGLVVLVILGFSGLVLVLWLLF